MFGRMNLAEYVLHRLGGVRRQHGYTLTRFAGATVERRVSERAPLGEARGLGARLRHIAFILDRHVVSMDATIGKTLRSATLWPGYGTEQIAPQADHQASCYGGCERQDVPLWRVLTW